MGKYRKYRPETKVRIVLEILRGEKSVAQASRDYQIKNSLLYRWKDEFLEGGRQAFAFGQATEQKRRADKIADLPRSSYYHQAKPRDQQSLREAIAEVSGRYPTYGSRRVAAHLKLAPYEMSVGRHLAGQLMRELGLAGKRKPRQGRGTDSQHGHRRYPNLVKGVRALGPNQIWVADISYIRLRSDFIYLALVMDVFTRAVRGWHLSWSCGRDLTLAALRKALQHHPASAIHHSDQGKQYADHSYVKLLQDAGTQISMAAVGKPEENGYAERLIRTIKEEEVYLSEYQSMADARQQIGHFINVVYHKERLHSALDYQTPAEFEAQWLQRNPPKNSGKMCPVL